MTQPARSHTDPDDPAAAVGVGVVGAGTMGAGIAQVALEGGHPVVLYDVMPGAIERGRERIRDGLRRRAARIDLGEGAAADWVDERLGCLGSADRLDVLAARAGIVIEAALEDLALKRDIFRELDAAASPEAILATNTSALSVTEIATAAGRPERVLGLHFFNPVPLMPLVEVVAGRATAPAVLGRAEALVRAWGKTAVRSADAPGFIVNRVNRPFTIEALRMLEAGEASVAEIDAAVTGGGFRMGPFELMDLAGLDVNLAAARSIWEGLGRPERLRPSPIQERLVSLGRLGRKTGSGFYRYERGTRVAVEDDFAATAGRLGADRILPRILEAIDAEALLARDEGVASASDIDRALRAGAAHPVGPFERMGAEPPAG